VWQGSREHRVSVLPRGRSRRECARTWPKARRTALPNAYCPGHLERAAPHTFRHQAITWLTRHSGLADAELQLITGHAKRETLAVYQHVALDGQLEDRYQQTMKDVGL
jgi:site-specific recombinase XerD